MFRKLMPLVACLALSACVESPTPEMKQTIDTSRQKLSQQDQSDWIMVGAEGFKRPVDVERVSPTQAVVIPVAGKLRYIDIEEGARLATGCQAKAIPAIYKAANNNPTRLLSNSVVRSFNYRLPVDLTC